MSITQQNLPAYGIGIADFVVRAKNGSANTVNFGETGVCDLLQTQSSTIKVGDAASAFATFVPANTAGVSVYYSIVGIWQEQVAAGQYGKIMLRGITEAKAFGATTGINKAESLSIHTGSVNLRNPGAANAGKCIGIALTADATAVAAASAALVTVLFNGIEGFGTTDITTP